MEVDGCGRGEDAVELGWENGGSGEAGWVGMCGVEKEGCDDNPHRLEDWIFHFESVVWGLWKWRDVFVLSFVEKVGGINKRIGLFIFCVANVRLIV